jgi:hypothetical protein
MANPGFKQYYISRYIDLMNTVFSCDNMLSYLDTVANTIAPEMTRHAARWGGSYDDWQNNVQRLRDFIIRRCTAMSTGLIECYNLNGPYDITFNTDPNDITPLQINSLMIDQFPYTGTYFGGVDLKLAVQNDTAAGYRFDRWLSANQTFLPGDSTATVALNLNGADTIIAHFVQLTTAVTDPHALKPALAANPTVFESSTTLSLDLPADAAVSLRVISVATGRIVAVPADGSQAFAAGQYSIRLDLGATDLPPGAYVVQCAAGNFRQNIQVIYMPH